MDNITLINTVWAGMFAVTLVIGLYCIVSLAKERDMWKEKHERKRDKHGRFIKG